MAIENFSARRINKVGRALRSSSYVEIGVSAGETFHSVQIADRTGVDPNFRFSTEDFANQSTRFFQVPSDAYFGALSADASFDQYFIDGLHTFEQTLRDFSNALMHSHSRTVWLIDDTKPSDVYSSLPDPSDTSLFRKAAGFENMHDWHGDVFKLVFYIHDFCPGLDYRTIVRSGNAQTLVWRSKHGSRVPRLNDLEKISRLDYFSLLKNADVLRETSEDEAIDLCISSLESMGRNMQLQY